MDLAKATTHTGFFGPLSDDQQHLRATQSATPPAWVAMPTAEGVSPVASNATPLPTTTMVSSASMTPPAPRSAQHQHHQAFPPPPPQALQQLQSQPSLQQQQQQRTSILAERFKTKMCRNFEQTGVCPYEHRCMFAHGEHELRTESLNWQEGLVTEEAVKDFKIRQRVQQAQDAQRQLQLQQAQNTPSLSPSASAVLPPAASGGAPAPRPRSWTYHGGLPPAYPGTTLPPPPNAPRQQQQHQQVPAMAVSNASLVSSATAVYAMEAGPGQQCAVPLSNHSIATTGSLNLPAHSGVFGVGGGPSNASFVVNLPDGTQTLATASNGQGGPMTVLYVQQQQQQHHQHHQPSAGATPSLLQQPTMLFATPANSVSTASFASPAWTQSALSPGAVGTAAATPTAHQHGESTSASTTLTPRANASTSQGDVPTQSTLSVLEAVSKDVEFPLSDEAPPGLTMSELLPG